jgi:hypothetical protein
MPPHFRLYLRTGHEVGEGEVCRRPDRSPTRKDGHHPIIYMQCGPVRFNMSARTMTETTPFEHK